MYRGSVRGSSSTTCGPSESPGARLPRWQYLASSRRVSAWAFDANNIHNTSVESYLLIRLSKGALIGPTFSFLLNVPTIENLSRKRHWTPTKEVQWSRSNRTCLLLCERSAALDSVRLLSMLGVSMNVKLSQKEIRKYHNSIERRSKRDSILSWSARCLLCEISAALDTVRPSWAQ